MMYDVECRIGGRLEGLIVSKLSNFQKVLLSIPEFYAAKVDFPFGKKEEVRFSLSTSLTLLTPLTPLTHEPRSTSPALRP